MKFNYQVRTKEGEIQVGTVEASSKEAALVLLQKHGFFVTYLEEAKPPIYARQIKIFRGVSLRDVVLFSRQLAIMFGSKVPLVEALRTIANQTAKLEFQEKIFDLSEGVEGGSTFSKALSRYPKVFSPFYIAMVKAGEASGKLAEALNYLADHLEREYHLSSRMKGAMMYPALILLVIVVVFILMIFLVVPNFEKIIVETGVEVPKITQAVLGAARFLKEHGFFLILSLFIVPISIYRYSKTRKGKDFFDRNLLKLPILGPLLKTIYLSRFAENLATLISGGLLVPKALEITGNIVGNSLYKEAVFSTRDKVRKGMPISSGLAVFPKIFPPIFVQITLVGEKTGTLDTSLKQIAIFYQKELEREIDNVLTVLEPALIVFLGLIVGGLMFSVLMPLYKMLSF